MRSAFKCAALMVSVQTLRDNNTHFILRFLGKLRNLLLGKGKRPEVASQNNTGTVYIAGQNFTGVVQIAANCGFVARSGCKW